MQEKTITEAAGRVTSVLRKDSKLVQLTLEGEGASREVDFPFEGNDLALRALTSSLLGNSVQYTNLTTNWHYTNVDYGCKNDYKLDVLGGPLSGTHKIDGVMAY